VKIELEDVNMADSYNFWQKDTVLRVEVRDSDKEHDEPADKFCEISLVLVTDPAVRWLSPVQLHGKDVVFELLCDEVKKQMSLNLKDRKCELGFLGVGGRKTKPGIFYTIGQERFGGGQGFSFEDAMEALLQDGIGSWRSMCLLAWAPPPDYPMKRHLNVDQSQVSFEGRFKYPIIHSFTKSTRALLTMNRSC